MQKSPIWQTDTPVKPFEVSGICCGWSAEYVEINFVFSLEFEQKSVDKTGNWGKKISPSSGVPMDEHYAIIFSTKIKYCISS